MKDAIEALDLGLAQAAGTAPAPAEPVADEPEAPVENTAPDKVEGEETPPTETAVEKDAEPEAKAPVAEETPEQKAEKEAAAKPAPAEETPEQKAAREAAAATPLDPLKDPIHGNVTERTRTRITTLIDMVKDRDEKIKAHQDL